MCCNIVYDFKEAFYKEVQDMERLSILSGLKKVVQTIMNESINAYTIEIRQNIFVCVLNVDVSSYKKNVLQAARNILNCFEYDLRYCKIFIGIGKVYSNINGI